MFDIIAQSKAKIVRAFQNQIATTQSEMELIQRINALELALDSANKHIANLHEMNNMLALQSSFRWTKCSDEPPPPFITCLFLHRASYGLDVIYGSTEDTGDVRISKRNVISKDEIVAWINIDNGVSDLIVGTSIE